MIRICDESYWKITSQMTISNMKIIQLYIRMNHVEKKLSDEVIMGS
jgi:hypothetical protein